MKTGRNHVPCRPTRSLTPYPGVAAPSGPTPAPKVRAIPTGSQAEIVRQLVPDPVRHLVEALLTVVVELFLRGRAVNRARHATDDLRIAGDLVISPLPEPAKQSARLQSAINHVLTTGRC